MGKLCLRYVLVNMFPTEYLFDRPPVPRVLGIGIVDTTENPRTTEVWSDEGPVYVIDMQVTDYESILVAQMDLNSFQREALEYII